jgi:hypothetical protein
MNSEEKAAKGCFWTLILMISLSFMLNVFLLMLCHKEPSVVIEHDTIWKDTTIYQPQAAETINTGRVVYIKVPHPTAEPSDTVHDTINVTVPIMQKRYDDSLYTAWVSGFEPALDSINLRLPTITETITQTIVKPSPVFTFGIQTGAGIGAFSRQPDIYIGVGGQLNLWRK